MANGLVKARVGVVASAAALVLVFAAMILLLPTAWVDAGALPAGVAVLLAGLTVATWIVGRPRFAGGDV